MRSSAVILLVLAGCAADGVAVGVPWLLLPVRVEIRDALPATVNDAGVPVRNVGTADAAIDATATPDVFTVAGETVYLAPGAEGFVPLRFAPDGWDDAAGTLTVTTGLDTWTLPITATVDRDLDDDGHDALGAGGDDCDDQDPDVRPSAAETCDGRDEDCSGVADDLAELPRWWPDLDGDGHGDPAGAESVGCDPPPASAPTADDCDDGDPAVHPGAAEVWYDGVDQDCDGNDDDQDGDGSPVADDCADGDPAVHPGAAEVWYDGVDQDCDGNDDDQDGDGDPAPADCADTDATVGPSAPELDDGLDQDCDFWIDEGLFARGTLIVTEILADPVATSDANGRYVELHNPTDGHVDLGAVTLIVGGRAASTTPAWLDPGGVVVLCGNADPALNGGLTCGGTFSWIGAPRSVEVEAGGVTLDEVVWTSWPPFPAGAALELAASALDPDANDSSTSWCAATAPFGAGDLGTPGVIAPPCP